VVCNWLLAAVWFSVSAISCVFCRLWTRDGYFGNGYKVVYWQIALVAFFLETILVFTIAILAKMERSELRKRKESVVEGAVELA